MSMLIALTSAKRMASLAKLPRGDKKHRIGKRVVDAIELLVLGTAPTIQAAADAVGMSRPGLSKALSRDYVRAYRERRLARALDDLETVSLGVLLKLVIGSESDHVKKDIALRVIQRHIQPPGSPVVNIDVTPGYIVRLPSDPSPLTIEHDHLSGGAA
jgi:hypothetical protein